LPTPEIFALADDLTGALEVGALFASAGARTRVGIECAPPAPVCVVDLESRHLEPAAAADRVAQFAQVAPFVFLKIDSTMRGPIGAGLRALAALWPNRAIFFTPAYPALGRTVIDGSVFVDGVPLAATAFAHDPTHPADSSRIDEILARSGVRVSPVRGIPADPAPGSIYAFDAATDPELDEIAEALAARNLLGATAGSGGFAGRLARLLPVERTPPVNVPAAGKPLVVSGSMHAISAAQLRQAGRWPVLECSAFANGRHALEKTAARARDEIQKNAIDTIVAFGGDTARALMAALGVRSIQPIGEALPGIPVSSILYEGRSLTLITKAGGFGGPDLLPQLAAALHTEI
jgi:D-threonate/D-erythronate kinase